MISRICEPRTLQEVAKSKSSLLYSLTYGGKDLIVVNRKHEVVNIKQK
jgi:flagellar biosynthesis/type III secretory pathway chaperone